ncbi:MAG: hypothetical protein NXI20_26725 [bacterium]|jgi:hypothetical protein|nr:hypothetical protein [bacterium]
MKALMKSWKSVVFVLALLGTTQFISCEEALEECVCNTDFPYSTDGSDTCYETKEVCEDTEGVGCFVCI